MKPEELPFTAPDPDDQRPLDQLIAVRLREDYYTLEEVEVLLRVMKKYRAVCELARAPSPGGLQ